MRSHISNNLFGIEISLQQHDSSVFVCSLVRERLYPIQCGGTQTACFARNARAEMGRMLRYSKDEPVIVEVRYTSVIPHLWPHVDQESKIHEVNIHIAYKYKYVGLLSFTLNCTGRPLVSDIQRTKQTHAVVIPDTFGEKEWWPQNVAP